MRLHVYLDDDLVGELDREVGARGRSAFVEECLRTELDRRRLLALDLVRVRGATDRR